MGARGVVVNPRSQNAAHMLQNLGFNVADGSAPFWELAAQLTPAELTALDARPQDTPAAGAGEWRYVQVQ